MAIPDEQIPTGPDMTWLADSYWYCPTPNLPAPLLVNLPAGPVVSFVQDQTVWHFTAAAGGYLLGDCATNLGSTWTYAAILGSLTPAGGVSLSFIGDGALMQTPGGIAVSGLTLGLGNLTSLAGAPSFLMQMSTGNGAVSLTHWAYMLRAEAGDAAWLDLPGSTPRGMEEVFRVGATAVSTVAGIDSFGSAAGDLLWGSNRADRLRGASGADTLHGGDGADDLRGGNHDDLLSGGPGADRLRGDAGADTLEGGDGNDRLSGGVGDDWLQGGAGADTLDGGPGADSLAGGAGNDSYQVDSEADIVVEPEDGGVDTVMASVSFSLSATVEHLTLLGPAGLTGTGNALANRVAGNAGANLLQGLDGDDSLDGGGGADTLVGGRGNDTYTLDSAADTVVELPGQGFDRIHASVSVTLDGAFAEVEHLSLTGIAALDGIGNGAANEIIGNAGANRLEGREGDDRLFGGGGADTLVGGTGLDSLSGGADADRFLFLLAGDFRDRVTDFTTGSDAIVLRAAGFGGGLAAGMLPGAAFASNLTGIAPSAATRLTYETDRGVLWWDPDGSGGGVRSELLVCSGAPVLAASDILLI
jgi:Ca2+-binding RTX toxin-like protein